MTESAEPKVEPKVESVLKEKKWYIITHPELSSWRVENFGDREFKLRSGSRSWEIMTGTVGGDPYWEINERNILLLADHILREKLKEIKKPEKQESEKSPEKTSKSLMDQVFGKDGLFHKIFGKTNEASK